MKLVIINFAVIFIHFANSESPPVVTLPNLGKVEGSYSKSLNGKSFYTFEGIPYAHPPIGEYRFKEPTPAKPWEGIWKAKTMYKCMQYNQYTPPGADYVVGDEDCLYLNIYTPTLDENANIDVIVFFHGGCFMFNYGGFYRPDYIMDKPVVYINMNYRLGPLGFLSTEDDDVPGNNGMKDQILALQWIKNNVKYFGGNPDSITISGTSAGGASVHFHYLSPKSNGLFHRGISQSGTILNPWVLTEKPLEKAKKLAAVVGCSTETNENMINCLRNRPGREIVSAVKEFQPWLYIPFAPFGIVVDTWSSDPLLPDHPYQLIKNKKVADLPWIASYTSSEGLYPASDFYIDENYLNDIDTRWNELIPLILDYNYTVDPKLHDEVSQKIRDYYFEDKKVSRETFMGLVQIISDRIFVIDIQKTARLQASVTTAPIYSYYFVYRGAHSRSEIRSGSDKNFGAAHGDDTCYVFKTNLHTTSTDNDRLMINVLTEIFISFAKTGKPKVPEEWPPVSKNPKNFFTYLKIEGPETFAVESAMLWNERFWDSLPIKENEKLFPEKKDEL